MVDGLTGAAGVEEVAGSVAADMASSRRMKMECAVTSANEAQQQQQQ